MDRLKFYRGETTHFTYGPIKDKDGNVADVSGDVVRFMVKRNLDDPDSAEMLAQPNGVTADVATRGASGYADFTLSETVTDIPEGTYVGGAKWEPNGGGNYVLDQLPVECEERVEDVP